MNGAAAIGVRAERGASSRYAYRTSQDETPVKDARSPQNAGAIWLPHAPLRGAFGVLDRRFAGRCQGLSSMRRTSTREVQMRSEEHTSELQSLMRISYAVFCLKKKITNKNRTHT